MTWLLFLSLWQPVWAGPPSSNDLVIRIVGAEQAGKVDKRIPLPTRENEFFAKEGWHCTAQTIGPDWGIVNCRNPKLDLRVSTRFACDTYKSFELSRSFAIAQGEALNVVFSIWCEAKTAKYYK